MRRPVAFTIFACAAIASGCSGGVDTGGAARGKTPVAALANTGGLATFTTVPFRFDGSASEDPDGFIVEWAWDFGDGESTTGQVVSHTYQAGGTLDGSLTVRDNAGNEDVEDFTIEVSPLSALAGNWSLVGNPPAVLCDYAVAFPAPDLLFGLGSGSTITAVPSLTGNTLSGSFENDGRLLLSVTTTNTSLSCGAASVTSVIESLHVRFGSTTTFAGTFAILFNWSDPFCNCTALFDVAGQKDP